MRRKYYKVSWDFSHGYGFKVRKTNQPPKVVRMFNHTAHVNDVYASEEEARMVAEACKGLIASDMMV